MEKQPFKKKDRSKMLVRILIFMLIGDLLIAAAVVYLLSPEGSKVLESVRRIPIEVVVPWIIGTAALFIALAVPLALRRARTCPEEFAAFALEMGLNPVRRWGIEGNFGNFSIFGFGPYYEIPYNGLALRYCHLVRDIFPRGGRLSLHHPRPLPYGFLCRYRLNWSATEARLPDEFKDIFAKRVDLGSGEDDLKVWAVKVEETSALLREQGVSDAMALLKAEIAGPARVNPDYSANSGFIVNYKAVTVIFEDATAIGKSLVDAMWGLSIAFANSPSVAANPSRGLADRIYKPVVVSLVILTITAVFAHLTLTAIEFLGW